MDISVIIPLYRAEQYIENCLRSLLAQTIIDRMEIIVVDDCGGDRSLEIVQKIIDNWKNGNHIYIVRMNRNSGAWAARNRGIECAKGRYVGFCDADDWVEPDMYERLMLESDRYDADFGFCMTERDYNDGSKKILKQLITVSTEFDAVLKRKFLVKGAAYFSTGLYSRKFLIDNGIMFPNSKFSEDSYFWWMVIMHANRVAVVNEIGYHYRIQNASVSRTPDTNKPFIKQLVNSKLLRVLKERGMYEDFKEELDFLYIKKGFLIPLITEAIINDKPRYIRFFNSLEEEGIDVCKNSYFRKDFAVRLLYFMFNCLPSVTTHLLKLKYKQDPF